MEKLNNKEYQIVKVQLYSDGSRAIDPLKLSKGKLKDQVMAVIADDAGKFCKPLQQKYQSKLPKKKGGIPLHAKYAKALGIAEHEPVSDAGCHRFLPNGAFMVEQIRRRYWEIFIEDWAKYGPCRGLPIISPVIIEKKDPGVKWLIGNFPEKKYWVVGDDPKKVQKEMFLRISSDYSAFSLHRDMRPSYKKLPFGFQEFENDFRYEQSGELRGLHRVREFHMQNIHSVCKNHDEAIDVMLQHFNQYYQMLKECNAKPDVLVMYALQSEWKGMAPRWISLAGKFKCPLLVMNIDKVNLYMCAWVDLVLIDSLGRPMEIGSSQLDISSAQNWGMKYIDQHGKRQHPVIIHAGVGYERLFAGMLERAIRGGKCQLPKWLAPIQVMLLPVSKMYERKANLMADALKDKGIRAEVDASSAPLGKRVYQAKRQWIPELQIVGEKEN